MMKSGSNVTQWNIISWKIWVKLGAIGDIRPKKIKNLDKAPFSIGIILTYELFIIDLSLTYWFIPLRILHVNELCFDWLTHTYQHNSRCCSLGSANTVWQHQLPCADHHIWIVCWAWTHTHAHIHTHTHTLSYTSGFSPRLFRLVWSLRDSRLSWAPSALCAI